MQYKQVFQPVRRVASYLDQVFLLPKTVAVDPAVRRTARMVTMLVLSMLLAGILEQFFGGNVPKWVIIILFVAYGLSRTRYHTIAAVLLSLSLCIPSYLVVFRLSAPTPFLVIYPLVWLAFPILLTTILFPLRWAALMAASNLFLISALPWLNPQIPFAHIIGALGFIATLSLLLLSLMQHRNQLEKERQAELRTSAERLELALNSAQMGIWTWDILSNQIIWSEKVYDLFGVSPHSFDGAFDTYLQLIHPDDREELQQAIHTALARNNSIYMVTHRIILPGGQLRWLEGKGQVYRDVQGNPLRMTGTVADITLAKELEMLMQQQARQNEMLAELAQLLTAVAQDHEQTLAIIVQQAAVSVGDGASVRTLSADGQWIELAAAYNPNPAQLRVFHEMMAAAPQRADEGLFGYVFHTGKPVFHPVVDQAALQAAVIPAQRPFLSELSFYSIILCPMRAQGEIMGVLGLARHTPNNPYTRNDFHFMQTVADRAGLAVANARLYTELQAELAERRRVESEREALIVELETKNAELERFTYTVSHDLKSPLVTMKGFLGFLEIDITNGDAMRVGADMHHIREAADKMQLLLNDLLELSRIGRLMNPPEMIPFGELVNDAIQLVCGDLQAYGVDVIVHPDLPVVLGDRLRLTEVVQNLLDNAAKFMGNQPRPRIEVGIEEWAGESAFFVRDNGIGILPQHQEKVFGLFEKLDPMVEGTGIGLALVKRIVEVHNGRIWIESAGEAQGCTFYFTLPGSPL